MEEEIAHLSQDLRGKEEAMSDMKSSLAEVSSKMEKMENISHKIGRHVTNTKSLD